MLKAKPDMKQLTHDWMMGSTETRYSYNFNWMGIRIIQYPQDLMAMHEIIWRVKPDLIVETGVAHGGTAVFYASMLELLGGDGRVVAIDIDIREHNRHNIEAHPMFKRIDLVQGSSIDPATVERVRQVARGRERILVVLDSNHTHDHVLAELEAYSPMVKAGSYLVVMDTIVEQMRPDAFPDRPWGRGNNPATALSEFLRTNNRFEVDHEIEDTIQITVAPGGFLRCVRDL